MIYHQGYDFPFRRSLLPCTKPKLRVYRLYRIGLQNGVSRVTDEEEACVSRVYFAAVHLGDNFSHETFDRSQSKT